MSWHDDDGTTRAASLDELHRLRLKKAEVEVAAGPDVGLRAAVGPTGLVIGTGQAADIRLRDELVSRRHLRLIAEPNGVRAVDLGSRNGTRVGGARIRDVLLEQDSVVSLGSTSLSIRLSATDLEVPVSANTGFGDAVGYSAVMRSTFALLEQAAQRDVTVLLEGDSGTGKEVLAVSLHGESPRRDQPFVVLDCGSVPENLMESELFGHERGAFTGAHAARAGAFEQAHGGTIFLDEVGELPVPLQPKLLRVLESRSFRRVGGSRQVDTNVRVIAATNRRLHEAVRNGEFRQDLFYRLAVVHVRVPPLAERVDDIAPLAELFLRRMVGDDQARLPPDLLPMLTSYDWPGNVRELRNVVERFATFQRTDPDLLFGQFGSTPSKSDDGSFDVEALARRPYHEAKQELVDMFHRLVLPRVLERAGGSMSQAAKLLGIPRSSLYRMLKKSDDDASSG